MKDRDLRKSSSGHYLMLRYLDLEVVCLAHLMVDWLLLKLEGGKMLHTWKRLLEASERDVSQAQSPFSEWRHP